MFIVVFTPEYQPIDPEEAKLAAINISYDWLHGSGMTASITFIRPHNCRLICLRSKAYAQIRGDINTLIQPRLL